MHLLRVAWIALPVIGAELLLPRVDVVYRSGGTVFDRNCSAITKVEADQNLIDEAARRTTEFQRWWDAEGPLYMKTALAEVGYPFPYQQMQATLTVCAPTSMSSPLLINVIGHLSKAIRPLPDWYFAFVVYHELMHHYVRPVYSKSPLRRKYAAAPAVTLNHIHVMALEKFVLRKLGKTAELKYLDERYTDPRALPAYRRAWEIVSAEGEDMLIRELKAANR